MKESAKGQFFENDCSRNNTVFLPISEVCNGKVSLAALVGWYEGHRKMTQRGHLALQYLPIFLPPFLNYSLLVLEKVCLFFIRLTDIY